MFSKESYSRGFTARKNKILLDRSRKGGVDAPIKQLLHDVNLHPDYVTTSSCSGRAVLLLRGTAAHSKSGGGGWLATHHGLITGPVKQAFHNALFSGTLPPSGTVTFRHEPFILHVECCSVEAGNALMALAVGCGFRETGLSVTKKRVLCAIRTTTMRIELPVAEAGSVLIPSSYFDVLLKESASKAIENHQKTQEFHKAFLAQLHVATAGHDEHVDHSGCAGPAD